MQILRKVLKFGVLDRRDPSLTVPQEELPPNSRFVWIPELEDEDIVGIVAEHAARAGIKSIAIPAYWILKEGATWSPAYDKAQKDEKMMLHFHGGAFVVRVFSPLYPVFVPIFVSGWDWPSISPNIISCQGNTQSFHVSLQSVVSRLPTQLRASFKTGEPIPKCSHRRDCGIQVSCLRGRVPAPEHHRGG